MRQTLLERLDFSEETIGRGDKILVITPTNVQTGAMNLPKEPFRLNSAVDSGLDR
ncbi:MAG: hypothetical protein P8Y03_25640 [Anaerolineales bacterium]